jgi:hypothetical protein
MNADSLKSHWIDALPTLVELQPDIGEIPSDEKNMKSMCEKALSYCANLNGINSRTNHWAQPDHEITQIFCHYMAEFMSEEQKKEIVVDLNHYMSNPSIPERKRMILKIILLARANKFLVEALSNFIEENPRIMDFVIFFGIPYLSSEKIHLGHGFYMAVYNWTQKNKDKYFTYPCLCETIFIFYCRIKFSGSHIPLHLVFEYYRHCRILNYLLCGIDPQHFPAIKKIANDYDTAFLKYSNWNDNGKNQERKNKEPGE